MGSINRREAFWEGLLNKEKLSEEDFQKLDKIWLQFLQWKEANGGLLSTRPAAEFKKAAEKYIEEDQIRKENISKMLELHYSHYPYYNSNNIRFEPW